MPFRQLAETVRTMRRRPGPTLAAMVGLTVAIALFAGIVGVVQGFLFRPSMIRDIDRVVRVRERIGGSAETGVLNPSPQVFDAWRRAQNVFEEMAAATTENVAVQHDATSDSLAAGVVTANFFHVLGIAPELGRDFASGEDTSGRDEVVLLGDATWRNRYAGDPNIVGRQLRIDGHLRTVVGVMPPRLSHPYGAELWIPFRWDELQSRISGHFLYVPARLRDGVDLAAAQAGLSTLTAEIRRTLPSMGQVDAASLTPLRDESVQGLRPTLWLLLASALFVVVVATLNTATMFHAQNIADARANFVRVALGAGGGAMFRRALARSGIVVGAAVVLALIAAPYLDQRLFGLSGGAWVREFDSVARLDVPTVTWIIAAAALIALGLAALDARAGVLQHGRSDLRMRGATLDHTTRRRLSAAIVAQCALSFTLAAAGLVVTLGYRHLLTMDRGYDSDRLDVADLAFPPTRYPTQASRVAVTERVLDALRALPGVVGAAASTVTPDFGGDWSARFVVPGSAPPPEPGYELTNHRLVSSDYLPTMGIPLVAGRGFDRASPERNTGSVIVSQSFANHAWPAANAVGKTIERVDLERHVVARLSVIGVAADVVEAVRDPDAPAARSWYLPTTAGTEYDYSAVTVVVRTEGAAPTLAGDMNRALAAIDRDLAWSHLSSMHDRLADSVSREQLSSFLFGLFAASSLLIALGGLYGALAFVVETSRPEFGVRLALGASARHVMTGLLSRTLVLAGAGVVAGLALALPLIRIVSAYVFGVALADAWTLLPLAVVVLALAAFVGFVPARRAARTNPAIVLIEQ